MELQELQGKAGGDTRSCQSSILRAVHLEFLSHEKLRERHGKKKRRKVKKVAAAEANDLFSQSMRKDSDNAKNVKTFFFNALYQSN